MRALRAVGSRALLMLYVGSVAVPVAGSVTVAGAQVASDQRCAFGLEPFASPFCAELVASPDLEGVRGMLELRWVRTPFGVAAAPDGHIRNALTTHFEGLPSPSSLGPYRAFVAWGYDITMGRETKLGSVGNGSRSLGELPYEHFRVIVSAESNVNVPVRIGRIVARATSPSALMLAHRDAMAPMMLSSAEADHAHHGGWPTLPVDPRLAPSMMAGMAPGTAPWLPDARGDAAPVARPREVLSLTDGDTIRLVAGTVTRTIGGRTFTMFGYNGQYPGPLLQVNQAAQITVQFVNRLPAPSTVHWHGLRLDNRFDGVPDLTQPPVAPGDSFTYVLRFPDAGAYWYHPHVREDIQQELGLYGNILVAKRRADARVRVHREEVLALDDMLLDENGPVPFGTDTATHALMGRFGNVLLVNGEPSHRMSARLGEVVRFYLTNVSNTRLFNVRIPGVRFKLIGSDLSDYEREQWVESVVIAPAERYIVEARFPRSGRFVMLNSVRWLDHMRGTTSAVNDTLSVITVSARAAVPDLASSHARLLAHPDVTVEVARYLPAVPEAPQHTLTLGLKLNGVSPNMIAMLSGMAVPVDWNDGMPAMNFPLTAREVQWTLRDENNRENMGINWQFTVGDVVRIRLVNDPTSVHAMAHPIHFHGQRFIVLQRNGVAIDNHVWKDTAVLPAGEDMDILLELTNPGDWMIHCHIAEHLGTGMMAHFTVNPR